MRAEDIASWDDAREIWNAKPFLRFAFADYQSFAEHYRIAYGDRQRHAVGEIAQFFRWVEENEVLARRRRGAASYPESAAGLSADEAIVRQGERLTVWMYGAIATGVGAVVEALKHHADAYAIAVRIDSPGGSVEYAFDLAGALLAHRGKKIALIDRTCWSAAVVVASACDRVHIRRDATMLVHRSRASASGTVDDLGAAMQNLRSVDQRYARFICARRRLAPSAFVDMLPREHYLDAEASVVFGLADCVIDPLPWSRPVGDGHISNGASQRHAPTGSQHVRQE